MIATACLSSYQPPALPGWKTASGGLKPWPRRRVGRTGTQPTGASGKNRPRYDFARRGAVLPQNETPLCKETREASDQARGRAPRGSVVGNSVNGASPKRWNDVGSLVNDRAQVTINIAEAKSVQDFVGMASVVASWFPTPGTVVPKLFKLPARGTIATGGYARSEERRVGNECVGTGRCRWSPEH